MKPYSIAIKPRLAMYFVQLLAVPCFVTGAMFITGKGFSGNQRYEDFAMIAVLSFCFWITAVALGGLFKIIKTGKGLLFFSLAYIPLLLLIGKLTDFLFLDSSMAFGKAIVNWNIIPIIFLALVYYVIATVAVFELSWLATLIAIRISTK